MCAGTIRANIDAYDEYHTQESEEESLNREEGSPHQYGHVYLGSRQAPQTISSLALANTHNPAYTDFRKKIGRCLTDMVASQHANGEIIWSGKPIKVHAEQTVSDIKKMAQSKSLVLIDHRMPLHPS